MNSDELSALFRDVQSLLAALRANEIARASELLAQCKLPELAASGAVPAGPEGAPLRAAVEEALKLAVEMQEARRAALGQSGASRRALGAYAKKRRR